MASKRQHLSNGDTNGNYKEEILSDLKDDIKIAFEIY